VPRQRDIYLSAADPTATFGNHLLRPRGAPLADRDVHYVEIGGAGMRGYSPLLAVRRLVSANAELAYTLVRPNAAGTRPSLELTVFGDAATGPSGAVELFTARTRIDAGRLLADAGVGLAVRGQLHDRAVRARLDFPLYVRQPSLGVDPGAGDGAGKLRWQFSFGDLW
jgi:hypothetical protein